MRTPTWLAAELETLNRRRMNGDIFRDEAITLAVEAVEAKDPDLMAQIHREWVGQRLDESAKLLNRRTVKEQDRRRAEASTGEVQPGFDDECSYFFAPDTFPDSTLLTETGAYAYDLLARAERHHKVAQDRVKFQERMVAAVGGNTDGQATLGEGKAALRASGGKVAAEG